MEVKSCELGLNSLTSAQSHLSPERSSETITAMGMTTNELKRGGRLYLLSNPVCAINKPYLYMTCLMRHNMVAEAIKVHYI